MNNYNVIISMIGTIAVINLIAIILQGTKRILRKNEGYSKLKVAINLGIIGGLFGIYATVNGYADSTGTIISVRDVGPMMAGCLGGPLGGLIAGFIAGIHRLIMGRPDIMLGTTIPCAISTVLIGLFCGLIFKFFETKKNKGIWALIIAILMECMHLTIVFIYACIISDINTSFNFILSIAPSFLFSNALAFGLMIFTTDMIDRYKSIERKKDELDVELNTATTIQKSMLPSITSIKNDELELYSDMKPAKQVGGDFFDFFFIDKDHLAFLIADVSGKGVPSALFMVISKTIIKNNLKAGLNIDEAIEKTNEQLFEENKEFMFVTAWIGIIEISTGKLQYLNAGHNSPIIKRTNKNIEYIENKSGIVLGAKKDSKYESFEIKLKKGDTLFLYTDGVTEAINKSNQQYGEDRLIKLISKGKDSMEELCKNVKKDIDIFTENIEQFDDITMLALRYNGKLDINELTVSADINSIDKVTKFINDLIKDIKCTDKTKSEINIIIDEIIGNITKYSYEKENGKINIKAYITEFSNILNIIFEDNGKPFNPLLNTNIDKNSSVNDRKYGGLGLGIVSNISDDIQYEYIDKKNILSIKKHL